MTVNDQHVLEIQPLLLRLRSAFIYHEAFALMSSSFERMIEKRRFEIASDVTAEARGLVVVGASGSGKTTAVEQLIRKHPSPEDVGDVPIAEVVSLRVPSPATVKHVGMTLLAALGYPMAREPSAAIIWDNARSRLRLRRTLFVHFDEAQDFFNNQNGRELQAVINTVKSLMQDPEWPVGIILSGMPSLVEMINEDIQLSRRLKPVYIPPVSLTTHGSDIVNLIGQFAEMSDLVPFDDHASPEFVQRLLTATDGQFGLTIELIIAAIEDALYEGSKTLDLSSFVRSYRSRTGCLDARNPFVTEEFLSIQSHRLLDDLEATA
ncbi:MAG: TniB family NTP-binding protein [Hyphomicrobiales bacterium]